MGTAKRDSVMRCYWENKSCSCRVPNVSLPQREWRRYLEHVAGRGPTASWSFESEIQPPGRRQGWQRRCQMLVLSEAPCQVLCLGSEHVQGKRLLFYRAAACGLNKHVLCSPPALADPPCPCERLVTSPDVPSVGGAVLGGYFSACTTSCLCCPHELLKRWGERLPHIHGLSHTRTAWVWVTARRHLAKSYSKNKAASTCST